MQEAKSRAHTGWILLPAVVAVISIQLSIESARTPGPKKVPVVTAVQASKIEPAEVVYLWKIGDLFERQGRELKRKPLAPTRVSLHHELDLSAESSSALKVQLSSEIDFGKAMIEDARDQKLAIENVAVGENYWRTSIDDLVWGKTHHFRVRAETLPVTPQMVQRDAPAFSRKEMGWQVPVQITSNRHYAFHLVEVSEQMDFKKSHINLVIGQTTELKVSHSGRYFVRIQGVTINQEVSKLSPIYEVDVHRGARIIPEQTETQPAISLSSTN